MNDTNNTTEEKAKANRAEAESAAAEEVARNQRVRSRVMDRYIKNPDARDDRKTSRNCRDNALRRLSGIIETLADYGQILMKADHDDKTGGGMVLESVGQAGEAFDRVASYLGDAMSLIPYQASYGDTREARIVSDLPSLFILHGDDRIETIGEIESVLLSHKDFPQYLVTDFARRLQDMQHHFEGGQLKNRPKKDPTPADDRAMLDRFRLVVDHFRLFEYAWHEYYHERHNFTFNVDESIAFDIDLMMHLLNTRIDEMTRTSEQNVAGAVIHEKLNPPPQMSHDVTFASPGSFTSIITAESVDAKGRPIAIGDTVVCDSGNNNEAGVIVGIAGSALIYRTIEGKYASWDVHQTERVADGRDIPELQRPTLTGANRSFDVTGSGDGRVSHAVTPPAGANTGGAQVDDIVILDGPTIARVVHRDGNALIVEYLMTDDWKPIPEGQRTRSGWDADDNVDIVPGVRYGSGPANYASDKTKDIDGKPIKVGDRVADLTGAAGGGTVVGTFGSTIMYRIEVEADGSKGTGEEFMPAQVGDVRVLQSEAEIIAAIEEAKKQAQATRRRTSRSRKPKGKAGGRIAALEEAGK